MRSTGGGKCAGDLALEAGNAEAAEAILEAGAASVFVLRCMTRCPVAT